jgi:hypothetical protein
MKPIIRSPYTYAPKLTYSNLGAKRFPGGKPRTPIRGGKEEKGGVGEGVRKGEGVGKGVGRKGEEKVKCFSPQNLLATRRL